jgi:hypothetical protein
MMGVKLRGFRAMMRGVRAMTRCGVGVMCGGFGSLVLIMLGGHAVMMRRFLVMLGGGVVMGAGRMLVRHGKAPCGSNSSSPQSREINMSGRVIFRELRARIVVTVGERIGKTHLTYAQGASAELVAAATIMGAQYIGLPVSTTHILSSGVAGTMAANGSGLQWSTVRSIALAWVITLPAAMVLAGGLYFLLRQFI